MTEFKREDRYLVLKRKDLATLPKHAQYLLSRWLEDNAKDMPERQYVVVESDWPEYETVFKLIEARVTGAPMGEMVLEVQRMRIAELENAIKAMVEDGWLMHGPEGLSEPQKLVLEVIRNTSDLLDAVERHSDEIDATQAAPKDTDK